MIKTIYVKLSHPSSSFKHARPKEKKRPGIEGDVYLFIFKIMMVIKVILYTFSFSVTFYFRREVSTFAVAFLLSPWSFYFRCDPFSFAVAVVGHRTFAMPRRARGRSETYELVFFKKTLLCRRERVKYTKRFSSFLAERVHSTG